MTSTDGPAPSSTPKRRLLRRRELINGLPPWRRLRSTRDFGRVERQGIRASGPLVAVTVRPGPGRLGLVVSKKVDNRASERNLVKRRLREIFRREKARYKNIDVVVTAREEAKAASYASLREQALTVLEQALQKLATTPAPTKHKGPPPRRS